MKRILLLILCLFISVSCYPQRYEYKTVPSSLLQKHNKIHTTATQSLEGFVDLTNFLPSGYVKDGTVDYTNQLQSAIKNNRKVLMPNFAILINDNSLVIPSNTIIQFQEKSMLVMKPSKKGELPNNPYYALTLNKVENVSINNCNIRGDRENHIGNKGEWGMGIAILGSSNITISGGRIVNCWGDGIYVGKVKEQSKKYKGYHIPSSSILIEGVFLDNNRRNGISITSAVKVDIKNCIIANTNGILPMSGIDIEPNSSLDLIKNINLRNVTTYNNQKDGILLVLTRMTSDKKKQEVSISIDGHRDIGSYSPMRIGSGFRRSDRKMIGEISINNTLWQDNEIGFRYNKGYHLLPKVTFRNNVFKDYKKGRKASDDKYLNTIELKNIRY